LGDTGTEYVRSRKKLEGSMREKKSGKRETSSERYKVSTGRLMENTGKCMGVPGDPEKVREDLWVIQRHL
jgi:hypothetical protein